MALGRVAAGQWAGLQGMELSFWKVFRRKEFGGERVFLLVAGKKAGIGNRMGERNVRCDNTPGWGESY
ncbi:hypothetical protein TNCV_4336731 [Trichonephila clavipes]|nr:hypothetical protein TNCV_4336731 [Trichonephila clavipes]